MQPLSGSPANFTQNHFLFDKGKEAWPGRHIRDNCSRQKHAAGSAAPRVFLVPSLLREPD